MRKLLFRHVISELMGRRLAWTAALFLLIACTFLVAKIIPDLRPGVAGLVATGLGTAAAVLGMQIPRLLNE